MFPISLGVAVLFAVVSIAFLIVVYRRQPETALWARAGVLWLGMRITFERHASGATDDGERLNRMPEAHPEEGPRHGAEVS